eukprot:976261_1
MTMDRYTNHIRRNDFRGALSFVAIALLLPHSSQGKSSLASIPTHHGTNLDSLHLNERGGGAATKKIHWKRYHPTPLPRTVDNEIDTTTPSISTSVILEPMEKYKKYIAEKREAIQATQPKASELTSIPKQQGQQEGLTPYAITCMSLLALQFGIQPLLVRKFTPQTIVRSSVVLVQEVAKFGIAGAIYFSGTKRKREKRTSTAGLSRHGLHLQDCLPFSTPYRI